MSGDNKDWSAPIELAGKLTLKVGHTHDEIVEMEEFARSLGWKVTPHEPCKTCEAIKQSHPRISGAWSRYMKRRAIDSMASDDE